MGCNHDSKTGESTCPVCEFDPFVKNNFFTGKMMGAREFITESAFHGEKMRHHNARLHGWGVVCGLKVTQHDNEVCQRRYVWVEPGTAVDCCGHEILVRDREPLDVLAFPAVRRLQTMTPERLHALQVCVRLRECPTEEVPVLYDECGCDDTQCAPNRILESFELDVIVDPPLPTVGRMDPATVLGVFTPGPSAALASFVRVADGGTAHYVDPASPDRIVQLDLARGRRAQIVAAGPVQALAVESSGAYLFAVVREGTELRVRTFKVSDRTAVDAANNRTVPGSTAASTAFAASTADASRALLTWESAAGDLRPWKADTTTPANVIVAAPGSSLGALPNLATFSVRPDGARAIAVEKTSGTVRLLSFTALPTILAGMPAGYRAVAATLVLQGATVLAAVAAIAVSPGTDSILAFIDVATGTLLTSAPLERTPLHVYAPDDAWLHVYEEEGSNGYVQSVDLSTLASAQVPDISVGRLAGATGQTIIALGVNGDAVVLDRTTFSDGPCADLWHHLAGCEDCDSPNCVVLATIGNYRYEARMIEVDRNPGPADARIDNRLGRRVLAPTQALQAWIECLQANGGDGQDGRDGVDGADGAPGIGLNVGLPKIIDIGWQHRGSLTLSDFAQRFFTPAGTPIPVNDQIQAIRDGQRSTPFIVYFNRQMNGIDRQTLRLHYEQPAALPTANGAVFTGIFSLFGHDVYGDIVPVTGALPTPHTGETSPFAVAFIPRVEWFAIAGALLQQAFNPFVMQLQLELPTLYVSLKGEFVFGTDGGNYSQDLVLDGDNVGGRVGRNEVRGGIITGGRNPSGNLTQGGRFESWFFLRLRGDDADDRNIPPAPPAGTDDLTRASALRPNYVNLMTADDFAELPGVTRAVADRIVAARRNNPFAGVRDLRQRARLTDREFAALKKHVFID